MRSLRIMASRRQNVPALRGAVVLACLCALALLDACSSSSSSSADATVAAAGRYPAVAEMTASRIETADGAFGVALPKGWKETVDQKNAPNIALWLVQEDYEASISFTPMVMNPALYRTLKKDGPLAVAKVSLSLKKENARDSVTVILPPELFRLADREYAAYEYSVDRGATVIRIVVFDTGMQFVECALLPATSPLAAERNRRLFETQQSVLASMKVQ